MSNEVVSLQNNELQDDAIKLKQAIENNDLVEIWQESNDYEKLAETTIKTMQYINNEQVKEFTEKLTKTNEKIMNLTFEGVKKHHEKQIEKTKRIHKNQLITYSAISFFVGIIATIVCIKLFF
ncbi:hypothetical protein [Campylobacter pinnipediorum]|uniref:hypothetical protein n=1 Tax=Campylobacter pinnipediorum TaxID=1965231 RepID=UPI00084E0022|nr:hypothetical protein [Campylobacter pinnipediorum]